MHHKLPYNATSYIKTNFADCFINQVRELKDASNRPIFAVDLTSDEIIYHLEFNGAGDLVIYDSQPAVNDNSDRESSLREAE